MTDTNPDSRAICRSWRDIAFPRDGGTDRAVVQVDRKTLQPLVLLAEHAVALTDLAKLDARVIPEALSNEDGDAYWVDGHVDPALAVLAVVLQAMVDVGAEHAEHALVNGPYRRSFTVSEPVASPPAAWSFTDQVEHANQLVRSVRHVWLRPDPDWEENMLPATGNEPDAHPFTLVPLENR